MGSKYDKYFNRKPFYKSQVKEIKIFTYKKSCYMSKIPINSESTINKMTDKNQF